MTCKSSIREKVAALYSRAVKSRHLIVVRQQDTQQLIDPAKEWQLAECSRAHLLAKAKFAAAAIAAR
jgi:hypothetical protein